MARPQGNRYSFHDIPAEGKLITLVGELTELAEKLNYLKAAAYQYGRRNKCKIVVAFDGSYTDGFPNVRIVKRELAEEQPVDTTPLDTDI